MKFLSKLFVVLCMALVVLPAHAQNVTGNWATITEDSISNGIFFDSGGIDQQASGNLGICTCPIHQGGLGTKPNVDIWRTKPDFKVLKYGPILEEVYSSPLYNYVTKRGTQNYEFEMSSKWSDFGSTSGMGTNIITLQLNLEFWFLTGLEASGTIETVTNGFPNFYNLGGGNGSLFTNLADIMAKCASTGLPLLGPEQNILSYAGQSLFDSGYYRADYPLNEAASNSKLVMKATYTGYKIWIGITCSGPIAGTSTRIVKIQSVAGDISPITQFSTVKMGNYLNFLPYFSTIFENTQLPGGGGN